MATTNSGNKSTESDKEVSCCPNELLSILSHELRSPLAVIKGYASTLLRSDLQLDEASQREFLEIIVQQADAAAAVVADILDNSVLETDYFRLVKEPVLLHNLCQRLVNEHKHLAPNHRFAVVFPLQFPCVEADLERVEQVLRNLLDNAIKYSDGGLIVVRGEILDKQVIISVADQGVGISPEQLNRLFEKYYRIKNPRRKVAGSGLGLPIARQIIEAHGGKIWATSKLGSGSTFCFSLPR